MTPAYIQCINIYVHYICIKLLCKHMRKNVEKILIKTLDESNLLFPLWKHKVFHTYFGLLCENNIKKNIYIYLSLGFLSFVLLSFLIISSVLSLFILLYYIRRFSSAVCLLWHLLLVLKKLCYVFLRS